MSTAQIALASDHAGVVMKAALVAMLQKNGRLVLDLGPDGVNSVDYPDFAVKLAHALRTGQAARGVLICGSGVGMSIAANRFPWIRCALVHDETTARLAREHNDANVMALGARLMSVEMAKTCLEIFLQTPFAGGRHAARVAKLGQCNESPGD